ncbi:TPA: hypothetical protein ACQ39K_004712 [Yersinia enterocolitica]
MKNKSVKMKTSTIRLPIDLSKALSHMAVDNERSLNTEMIYALKRYVETNKNRGIDV